MIDSEVLIGGFEKVAIKIHEYDPTWVDRFAAHHAKILHALGLSALQIEHIGSTSVPGLAAKPIIDILVVVADSADESVYLNQLVAEGYQLRVREPDFFEHRMMRTPERNVHIHIYSAGCGEIERYLLLRNYLRIHADAREEYASVKRKLAQHDWADMNEYAQAKTEIVERMILAARLESGARA